MRRGVRSSRESFRWNSWLRGRIRLALLLLCCLAAAGLAIPAASVSGRLLASSGVAGRTPTVSDTADLTGISPHAVASVSAATLGRGVPSTPSSSPSPLTSASSSSSGLWGIEEAPPPVDAPSNTSVILTGVACASVASCVAVGYETTRAVPGGQALIETMNGGVWTAREALLPSQFASGGLDSSQLNSVICATSTSCIAVGSYEDSQENIGALIETLNGSVWTAVIAPLPTEGRDAGLSSISCTSASFCVAVGSYEDSNGDHAGLIETLSGGTWTGVEAQSAGGASPALSSVSCGAAGFCAAVGTYQATIGVIETLSDGNWTAVSEPLPANATSNPADGQGFGLSSVTCPSGESCVAVGSYLSSQGSVQGVIEDLSTGAWTPTEAPLPADGDTSQNAGSSSVTCSSAQSCVVFGGYNLQNNQYKGVIDTLSQDKWKAETAPLGYPLSSAACIAETCVGVGTEADDGALTETNATGLWTATQQSPPTNVNASSAFAVGLGHVVCPASGQCVAIGYYTDSSGQPQSMIAMQAGSATSPPPTPFTGTYVALGDSYSSGEGDPPYLSGTNNGTDECHRSALSYSFDVSLGLGFYGSNFSFHACSGALIQDFLKKNKDNQEPPQLQWLNASTRLVTLTIGGNNADFAEVMADCVLDADCQTGWQYFVDHDITAMSSNLPSNPVSLEQLYLKIKKAAPNAKVLIVGYPRLFPTKPPLLCLTGFLMRTFNVLQMKWINSKIEQLDNVIAAAARQAGVTYVDTYSAFSGHELCTGDPYVNSVLTSRQLHILVGSFHPNTSGNAALDNLVEAAGQ
jgi:hypothetical protein